MSAGGSTRPRYFTNAGVSLLPEKARNGSQREICVPTAMARMMISV